MAAAWVSAGIVVTHKSRAAVSMFLARFIATCRSNCIFSWIFHWIEPSARAKTCFGK